MTTVLVACDKFKGSATAAEVARALGDGLRSVPGQEDVEVLSVPVADGGDGTAAAAISTYFERHTSRVTGPYGDPVMAEWAFDPESGTAVVEVAAACGLALADPEALASGELDAARAGTRGVGQLVRAALDAGARRLVLGLGGSATTDGGAGLVAELGARLTDARGKEIGPGARGLAALAHADLSGLDPRLAATEIVVASDVTNPLCGPDGAAAVYGPQKGLSPQEVEEADAALARYADLVEQSLGVAPGAAAEAEGAGAAGGLGFATVAVLGGAFRPGADVVLDMVGFDEALERADLVVTGEGKLDAQTLFGKAPAVVLERARRRGLPVVAVCGACDLTEDEAAGAGFERVLALTDLEPDVRACVERPLPLLERLGRRLLET